MIQPIISQAIQSELWIEAKARCGYAFANKVSARDQSRVQEEYNYLLKSFIRKYKKTKEAHKEL